MDEKNTEAIPIHYVLYIYNVASWGSVFTDGSPSFTAAFVVGLRRDLVIFLKLFSGAACNHNGDDVANKRRRMIAGRAKAETDMWSKKMWKTGGRRRRRSGGGGVLEKRRVRSERRGDCAKDEAATVAPPKKKREEGEEEDVRQIGGG